MTVGTLKVHGTFVAVDGPKGRFRVPAGEREGWSYGRGSLTRAGVVQGLTDPGLSRRALRIAHPLQRTDDGVVEGVYVSTKQGHEGHTSGGVEILGAMGQRLHFLSSSGTPRVPLWPGRYELLVHVRDPVCRVSLTIEQVGPAVRPTPARGPHATQLSWDLSVLLSPEVPDDEVPYSAALLVVAVFAFDDLRGRRTPSQAYQHLARQVLGWTPYAAQQALTRRAERRALRIPEGSERIRPIADELMSRLNGSQMRALHDWLVVVVRPDDEGDY